VLGVRREIEMREPGDVAGAEQDDACHAIKSSR
jgi:hypothetical protein